MITTRKSIEVSPFDGWAAADHYPEFYFPTVVVVGDRGIGGQLFDLDEDIEVAGVIQTDD